MRVLAYIRVSTQDQAESRAGLDAQRAAILSEAKARGWSEVEFIEDAGYSAKSLNRPGMKLALERMKAGDASVLIVSKMDRLSRSLLDFATVMQTAQRQGWALLALDSPTDMTTPSGEAMAGMQAVFAQLERRLIGQRTKEALAQRKAAGVRLGRPPTLPDAVVTTIDRHRASGLSFAAIADRLNSDGVPTAHGGAKWWPGTVRKVTLRA